MHTPRLFLSSRTAKLTYFVTNVSFENHQLLKKKSLMREEIQIPKPLFKLEKIFGYSCCLVITSKHGLLYIVDLKDYKFMKKFKSSDSALQNEYSNQGKNIGRKFTRPISRSLEELDGVRTYDV